MPASGVAAAPAVWPVGRLGGGGCPPRCRSLAVVGVVGAACHLPGVSRIWLLPASPPCCDRTAVEAFHPHTVQWRLVAHGAARRGSPRPCLCRSWVAGAVPRTCSSDPDTPVVAVRTIILPRSPPTRYEPTAVRPPHRLLPGRMTFSAGTTLPRWPRLAERLHPWGWTLA